MLSQLIFDLLIKPGPDSKPVLCFGNDHNLTVNILLGVENVGSLMHLVKGHCHVTVPNHYAVWELDILNVLRDSELAWVCCEGCVDEDFLVSGQLFMSELRGPGSTPAEAHHTEHRLSDGPFAAEVIIHFLIARERLGGLFRKPNMPSTNVVFKASQLVRDFMASLTK